MASLAGSCFSGAILLRLHRRDEEKANAEAAPGAVAVEGSWELRLVLLDFFVCSPARLRQVHRVWEDEFLSEFGSFPVFHIFRDDRVCTREMKLDVRRVTTEPAMLRRSGQLVVQTTATVGTCSSSMVRILLRQPPTRHKVRTHSGAHTFGSLQMVPSVISEATGLCLGQMQGRSCQASAGDELHIRLMYSTRSCPFSP